MPVKTTMRVTFPLNGIAGCTILETTPNSTVRLSPGSSRSHMNPTQPVPRRKYVPYSTTRPKIESWEPPKVTN
eukprot:Em0548g2a